MIPDVPVRSDEVAMLGKISSDTIEVRWEALQSVDPDLVMFYGYVIECRDAGTEDYTEYGSVSHSLSLGRAGSLSYTLTGLDLSTLYEIRITPYRIMDDIREPGNAFPTVLQKTNSCGKLVISFNSIL
jgi:hypothetical protein